MILFRVLTGIRARTLPLTISLLTVLACSQIENAVQRVKAPILSQKKWVKATIKQPESGEFFDFKQLPQYVFGFHVVPFMRGRDIHNFVRTAKSLRCAVWEELPFFFKGEKREQQLKQYLAHPEYLIPLATMCLNRYVLTNYPSAITAGSVRLPSTFTSHKRAKMVDLLAIKSDLFIRFLDSFKELVSPITSEEFHSIFSHSHQLLFELLAYKKACLLTAMYDYLLPPNVFKVLHIPDGIQMRNADQCVIYNDFVALAALQGAQADNAQRQSAQKLLQSIFATKGNSWMARIGFVEIALFYANAFLHYEAVCHCTRKVSKRLIQCGADVNERDSSGQTPLHYATRYTNSDAVEFLLTNRAHVNPIDLSQSTPLTWAAQSGNVAVVSMLLARGASIDHSDQVRRTPLHYATRYNHLAVVRLLLEQGADVHKKDINSDSMLHMAVHGNALEAVRILVEKGADINAQDCHGSTPLHLVANFPHRERMTRLLLANNIDVNVKDIWGFTPLAHTLCFVINFEVAQLLIAYGANVNAFLPTGETVLQRFEYMLMDVQMSAWRSIMGKPPHDSDQAKYIHSLAAALGIKPSFQTSLPPPTLHGQFCRSLPWVLHSVSHHHTTPPIISPQELLFVLSQYSHAHIKRMFGDKVLNEVKRAFLYQQIMTLLKKSAVAQQYFSIKWE